MNQHVRGHAWIAGTRRLFGRFVHAMICIYHTVCPSPHATCDTFAHTNKHGHGLRLRCKVSHLLDALHQRVDVAQPLSKLASVIVLRMCQLGQTSTTSQLRVPRGAPALTSSFFSATERSGLPSSSTLSTTLSRSDGTLRLGVSGTGEGVEPGRAPFVSSDGKPRER